jgi:excisionase family DNA binding protein
MADLKVREIAEKLNCSEQKVRQMIQEGVIKSYLLPGTRCPRVTEEELKKIRGC